SQAAAVGDLEPMLKLLAARMLLDESLSLLQIAGLTLVMFGVTRLKPRSAATRAADEAAAAPPARQ
ncbi:MAG TPA: EamA/RhaT family transporter, partial [Noviherbaspirillum sp.]